jgi:hypothetical protein
MYILNGTVFLVSDQPEKLPDRKNITSNAGKIQGGLVGEQMRLPNDKHMRIIGTKEAKQLFGTGASIIDGVTVDLAHSAFILRNNDSSCSFLSMITLNSTS